MSTNPTNVANTSNVNAPQTALVPVIPSIVPYVPQNDDEEGSSQTNLSYKNVDLTKIGYITPAAKEAKGKDPNTGKETVFKYFETKLNYNYGNETTSFDVEWDEPVEFAGITYNNGKPSMMARFKNNDNLIKFNDRVYLACAAIVDAVKNAIQKSNFLVSNPDACGFKPINFYKTDNGKRIDGSKPTHFLKLLNGKVRTLFTDLKGNPVDWKFLHNVDVTLVPKVRYSHIFSNGTQIMVKVVLLSAFILDIQRVNAETTQKFSMGKFIKQHPNSVKKLEEQLQKIKLYADSDNTPVLASGPKDDSGKKDDKATTKESDKVSEKTPQVSMLPAPQMSHQMQQQYSNFQPPHMQMSSPLQYPPQQYGHQGSGMQQPSFHSSHPAHPTHSAHSTHPQYIPPPGSVQQFSLSQGSFSHPSNVLS
jgi:hypothetical protein